VASPELRIKENILATIRNKKAAYRLLNTVLSQTHFSILPALWKLCKQDEPFSIKMKILIENVRRGHIVPYGLRLIRHYVPPPTRIL